MVSPSDSFAVREDSIRAEAKKRICHDRKEKIYDSLSSRYYSANLFSKKKERNVSIKNKEQVEADKREREARILSAIATLTQEIRVLEASDSVAPSECWVKRYQAQGTKGRYWYYKLHASDPIFPSRVKKGSYSKYRHLGKAGSEPHVAAVLEIAQRGKIEALKRAIDSLSSSLSDVYPDERK